MFLAPFTCGTGQNMTWNNFDYSKDHLEVSIAQNPPMTVKTPSMPPTGNHIVTAVALNIRLFPWTQDVEPSIVGQLKKGDYVTVKEVVRGQGQSIGGYHIGPDRWINGGYVSAIAG